MKIIEEFPAHTVLYLSHGGGPLPLLGDKHHEEMLSCLNDITSMIAKPSAILVVSAHWEESRPTITHGTHPALIYDYYGFPERSYEVQYPAPGHPLLARSVFSLLSGKGIDAGLNDQRGFDHGLFIPLKIMYPDADIPCIQLSLVNSLNPIEHIKIGEALSELQQEGLLIIGSGMSFHNMDAFFQSTTTESQTMNDSFEKWLRDTCSNEKIDEIERTHRLEQWAEVSSARYCHPREEHLLPLHVCYGVAKHPCRNVFKLRIMEKKVSMYLW